LASIVLTRDPFESLKCILILKSTSSRYNSKSRHWDKRGLPCSRLWTGYTAMSYACITSRITPVRERKHAQGEECICRVQR
jgi:hypothetical protein